MPIPENPEDDPDADPPDDDEDEDEEEEYPGNTDALPSGEDLARELEEFLREQRRERGQE